LTKESILIGGASGFWGKATHATAQLLTTPELNYLVYDSLAEITLSIMARARAKDALSGYATDFDTEALTPNLQKIANKGVRALSNAGGMNPSACAQSVRAAVAQAGLPLQVIVVEGDDLMDSPEQLSVLREMLSDETFPDTAKAVCG